MDFINYHSYFENIVKTDATEQVAPYNDVLYYDYTRLNWSRFNRWLKTGKLTDEIIASVAKITEPQNWLVITEPWCGDAAHVVPFIEMIARLNPNIHLSYELRDAEPFSIDRYLTNGSKSIPKLVIRDATDKDLAVWGPRPADCQKVYDSLLAEKASFDTIKLALQNWYNVNKGQAIQAELNILIASVLG
ncbi:thioredoxin family protein [Pelobium manganitolerans]|uniref:thioredoxin family protein n=1 Tax=Pelobium manganitolerans TaxID=1842495 RepID=UPI003FA34B68